jgi:hypothetical protein
MQGFIRVPKKLEQMLVDMYNSELATPCSDAEVAEALHTISCLTTSEELIRVIRRLVFERDLLRNKCNKQQSPQSSE